MKPLNINNWLLKRTNREYVDYLSASSSVSSVLAQLLINKGIKTPEDAKEFLSPSTASDIPPHSIDGMSEACEAIDRVRKNGGSIVVSGDYDADGVTATAIMTSALEGLGVRVFNFIPNRFRHGYGFSLEAVKLAVDKGAKLIITVDSGITSFETCRAAQSAGIDVVITDHHEPSAELPKALAIVNPKVSGLGPGAIFSGAGLALKIAQGLGAGREDFYDLAAVGTLADVVPLVGENRLIVKEGLNLIAKGSREGIKALRDVSGLSGREIKAGLLSYTLVPRLNAAGRLGDASEAMRLLLTASAGEAIAIAASLDRMNAERQKVEEAVYQQALELLAGAPSVPAIVIWGEGWHEGVIGIVAARLAEKFGRPAFVLSVNGGLAKGSARSIPGFDLQRCLHAARGLLSASGGHKQAAGMRLPSASLEAFRDAVFEAVSEDSVSQASALELDAEVSLEDLSMNLAREISRLEPFGEGNCEPLFGSRGLRMINPRVVGSGHLKTRLKGRRAYVDAIGFDMAGLMDEFADSEVDAAYSLCINEWNGNRAIQLNLKALRPSENA